MKKIITHPGVFHADDVCAIAWLRICGVTAPVERRNPTVDDLNDSEILVVDVGGEHAPARGNFDHHQRGGAGSRWDSEVPYAAFGLVYDRFQPADAAVAQRFHDRVVLPVDAADCGWGTQEGTRPNLSFSAVIAGFNPGPSVSAAERDAAFETATAFARQVLENELRAAADFVAAKQAVMEASTASGTVVSSANPAAERVLVLKKFVPWGEHIFNRPDEANLLYVVFPSERGGWMVQQVPKSPGSFEGRKPLPEPWAGLRGEELAEAAGLATHGGSTFCHPGRFVAGAETIEDAARLANLAVVA